MAGQGTGYGRARVRAKLAREMHFFDVSLSQASTHSASVFSRHRSLSVDGVDQFCLHVSCQTV